MNKLASKKESFLNDVDEVKDEEVKGIELTDIEIVQEIEKLIQTLMKKKGDKYILSIGKLKGCIEKLNVK